MFTEPKQVTELVSVRKLQHLRWGGAEMRKMGIAPGVGVLTLLPAVKPMTWGAASPFTIPAGAAITTIPGGTVNGDVGPAQSRAHRTP